MHQWSLSTDHNPIPFLIYRILRPRQFKVRDGARLFPIDFPHFAEKRSRPTLFSGFSLIGVRWIRPVTDYLSLIKCIGARSPPAVPDL
jgi:hypothetical protein